MNVTVGMYYPPTQGSSNFKFPLPAGKWSLVIDTKLTGISSGTVIVTSPIRIGSNIPGEHTWYRGATWYTGSNGKSYIAIRANIEIDKSCELNIKVSASAGNPTVEVAAKAFLLSKHTYKCFCDITLIMTQGCKCGGV